MSQRLILWLSTWTLVCVGIVLLLGCLHRRFRTDLKRIGQREDALKERVKELETERERWQASAKEREQSIQEIAGLYQLSKQFLATLDWEEAQQITEEALAKWMPSFKESDRNQYLQRMKALVEQGQVSVEALIQSIPLAGTDFSARDRWAIVSGQLALGLQRVSLYRQVQESASQDGLTGLLVRRNFLGRLDEEIDRALRHSASLAFLMVDLDRFKQVNDTYGHLVGDVVLREIAHRIHSSVREMDLVGRYGGEEFAVALPDAELELGIQIAERIRLGVETAAIHAYDEEIRITVSIGVALYPLHAATSDQLIEKGDRAMYKAKALGRNQTVAAAERMT